MQLNKNSLPREIECLQIVEKQNSIATWATVKYFRVTLFSSLFYREGHARLHWFLSWIVRFWDEFSSCNICLEMEEIKRVSSSDILSFGCCETVVRIEQRWMWKRRIYKKNGMANIKDKEEFQRRISEISRLLWPE